MARALTLNGASVLDLRLIAPIAAAWVADVAASSSDAITGSARIFDGTNEWRGTILASGVQAGICSATIVGGAGGLRKELAAKSYVGSTVRSVVNDILREAGEQLAQRAVTAPALREALTHWTRSAGTAGEQLGAVLEAAGATWRVLPAGTVWVGSPAFVAAKPEGLFELNREPARGRVHVALNSLDLVPDTTVAGGRVGDVEYRIADGGLHATYWLEAA